MKKIECIIRPNKLDDLNKALSKYGIKGMTVTQVLGCGSQKGNKNIYRGAEVDINLLPKLKVEIVLKEKDVEEICQIIIKSCRTGEVGDGKIFILPVENAIRIRTNETGEEAL